MRLRPRQLAFAHCLLLSSAVGRAQTAGERIQTNAYAIDLHQGPVLASNRATGLAGAFVAMADGIDGNTMNPASPAVRVPYSYSEVDYDLGGGVVFPGGLGRSGDFFNSGSKTRVVAGNNLYVFLSGGFNLQVGRWGFGVTADLQQYSLRRQIETQTSPGKELTTQIMQNHLLAAYAFADDQLVIGVGARVVTLNVSTRATLVSSGADVLNTNGGGIETGFVWRPNGRQVRLGGAFRAAVSAESPGTVLYRGSDDELYLPERVSLPWDLSFGGAIQLGRRPLNPPWVSPHLLLEHRRRYLRWQERERQRRTREAIEQAQREHRDVVALTQILAAADEAEAALDRAELERAERDVYLRLRAAYAALPRFHVLLTSSMLLTGPVEKAVGIEGFLDRKPMRSGQQLSLSPRLAVEIEPIPEWLQARAGFYFEPTRFAANEDGGRSHGTLGLDLKLLPWDVFGTFPEGNWFRVGGSLDAAREYLGWGISVGVWH